MTALTDNDRKRERLITQNSALRKHTTHNFARAHEPTRNAEGVTEEDDYFTEEERAGLDRWRVIVADMPPMTQEEIDRVAAVFRRIDARRHATT